MDIRGCEGDGGVTGTKPLRADSGTPGQRGQGNQDVDNGRLEQDPSGLIHMSRGYPTASQSNTKNHNEESGEEDICAADTSDKGEEGSERL